MKRQSKAEEAINIQIKNFRAERSAIEEQIRQLQAKLDTMDFVIDTMEMRVEQMKLVRLEASQRNKS